LILRSESAPRPQGDNDFSRIAYKNDQKLKK
jgi:hypothetical protein